MTLIMSIPNLYMADMYMPLMDSTITGICGRMNAIEDILETHDMELYEYLDAQNLDVSFFAVR